MMPNRTQSVLLNTFFISIIVDSEFKYRQLNADRTVPFVCYHLGQTGRTGMPMKRSDALYALIASGVKEITQA